MTSNTLTALQEMKNVIMDYIFHSQYYAKKISRKSIKSPINNIAYPYFNALYHQGHNILYGEIELFGRKYNFIEFSVDLAVQGYRLTLRAHQLHAAQFGRACPRQRMQPRGQLRYLKRCQGRSEWQ